MCSIFISILSGIELIHLSIILKKLKQVEERAHLYIRVQLLTKRAHWQFVQDIRETADLQQTHNLYVFWRDTINMHFCFQTTGYLTIPGVLTPLHSPNSAEAFVSH